ncbi:MAG: DinB family protein [Flavobacteriales bacterium]|nr:DinB family protein [Flavobacteriales bacterium]
MSQAIEVLKTSRKMLAPYFENYTLEQLNTIPKGFSNNLIWQLGHIIVTEQLLVRKLSGLPLVVSDEIVDKYKKASKPEENVTQEEVDQLKELLNSTLAQTEKDYKAGNFVNYTEYPTSTGFVIHNVEEALTFCAFHEGIHLGNMMSMRKLL